jgi:peptidoglycan hydrolase CwlO-like protein
MLQQMETSYRLNGGMSDSNISLDDKPKIKKRTLIYVVAGLLAIILIMLVLLLAASALVIYIFWIGFVEFPTSSLQQSAVTPQQLESYTTQVDGLYNEVEYLQDITNISILEINALIVQLGELQEIVNSNFATVEAVGALTDQLNQHSEITKRNITTVNSQINTVRSETVTLNDHISRLDGQISTIRNDITTVQGQASGLQTSLNNVNSRLESPINLYQNCQQDTSVCNITTFRDTRLFCNTMAILRDIEVRET